MPIVSRKTIWIAAVPLAVIAVAEQFLIPNLFGYSRFIYDYEALVYLCLISAVLGLVLSVVPVKDRNYLQRLESSILMVFIVCSFLTDITYGSLMFRGKSLFYVGSRRDYKEAKTVGDCNALQDGTYEDENLVLIRRENRQTQINKKSHTRSMYLLNWIGACEYELIAEGNPKRKALVKITSVSADGFTCIISWDDGNWGREYTYKRN